MIAHIIIIILLIGLGILFSFGKGAFLISGYNTMSQKERSKYDAVALCKFMGKLMFAIAGCILCWLADDFFPDFHLFAIGQILLIFIILWGLVYANTKGRFKVKKWEL